MATLTEYPLPLNPLPYSPRVSFLKFLTVGATGDYVYYTKNVSNVVGELALTMKDAATGGDQPSSTASHKRVREWMVPAKLLDKRGWCDLQGITHDTAGLIWIACVDGNRLLSLDTGVGLYTAFFGGGPGQEVFPAPRDLQFDARGILWFTAATSVAPMIGRFDRTTMKVTTWTLPSELSNPAALAVEASGRRVWFCSFNGNASGTGPPLGMLDVVANEVTMWSFSGRFQAECHGIALDDWNNPASVWFTHDDRTTASRVYRYRIGSPACDEFVPALISAPRRVVADGADAWVTDWANHISFVPGAVKCGSRAAWPKTIPVRGRTSGVTTKDQIVTPTLALSKPLTSLVAPTTQRCFTNYPLPLNSFAGSLSAPTGLVLTKSSQGKPILIFAEAESGQIGVLEV